MANSTLPKVNEYSLKKDSGTSPTQSMHEYKVFTNILTNMILKITLESSIHFSFYFKLIEKM